MPRRDGHLYTPEKRREFEARYGVEKGDRVFGATVGKVRRGRMAKGLCTASGCRSRAVHYHGIHGCCGKAVCHSMITGQHQVASIGDNFRGTVL